MSAFAQTAKMALVATDGPLTAVVASREVEGDTATIVDHSTPIETPPEFRPYSSFGQDTGGSLTQEDLVEEHSIPGTAGQGGQLQFGREASSIRRTGKMANAKRVLSFRLILAVGLAVLVSALPAMAQDLTGVIVDFPDSGVITVQDLTGNPIGEGEHSGTARCYDGNCGQKTELQFTDLSVTVEYKFKNLQALAPTEKRAVVGGTGLISSEDGKEKFSFTAIFQDNSDGSVMATYVASRPDASFIVTAPGTLTFVERP
jgi:hypothetical protein